VSRAIARLERRLGARLFDRTTRAVRLTEAGRRFHQQVTPLLAGLEEAAAQVGGSAQAISGRLRVNIDPFFSRLILAPRLDAFLARYPELVLDLVSREQPGDLVAEGFDLAVRFGPPRASALHARKLLETRILTVAAPAYLKKYGRPRQPADLAAAGHRYIQFRDPQTGRPFEWEFRKGRSLFEYTPRSNVVLNDVGTLHNLLRSGFGIGQTMELGAEPYIADGSLVVLFPEWCDERWPLYALYPHRQLRPAKIGVFLDFVSELTGARPLKR
jgi:DNA-binding transcriptional LysR family regulator